VFAIDFNLENIVSKTFKHHPEARAMSKVAKAAKKTVQFSREARRARKTFSAYIARRMWNDDLLT